MTSTCFFLEGHCEMWVRVLGHCLGHHPIRCPSPHQQILLPLAPLSVPLPCFWEHKGVRKPDLAPEPSAAEKAYIWDIQGRHPLAEAPRARSVAAFILYFSKFENIYIYIIRDFDSQILILILKSKHNIHLCFTYHLYTYLKIILYNMSNNFVHETKVVISFL